MAPSARIEIESVCLLLYSATVSAGIELTGEVKLLRKQLDGAPLSDTTCFSIATPERP
jgi:hypothetical protein